MDLVPEPRSRSLWTAAMIIYEAMTEHSDTDRAALIAYAWDYLTSDRHGTFPPLLMHPTQAGVTERLVTIANRARFGVPLCPELEA
jgi:hypothetical protein